MQRMIRSIFILCLLGSFTVVSAQLPPEIRVDAYLLQAEQSIQDGDHNRARDAMQNIHNLQEQHGLDLSDEFHFRYAKAADVLDMPDQALESVVKYLAVSGREGQHYLEALALMNMAARFNENLDILKVLIDAGADLNARDHNDHTPLYFATEDKDRPDVAKILRDAGATQTKITGKSQGDGFRTATALIGAAAIAYAGKDSEDQEAVAEAAREYMEGVLKDQPVRNENNSSVATPSQTQDGQAQDSMQQALQNLENVCGEKYQNNFSDIDHGRFYCLAAFNYYCGLKRAQSSEDINKLRASLEQVCTVLKRDGLDSKCSYCK